VNAALPFPRVSVELRCDTSAEVMIQGLTHFIPATGDPGATRRAAIAAVALYAAGVVDRPVRVAASDPTGGWPLVVHPTGRVEAGDTATHEPAPSAVRLQVAGQRPSGPARAFLIGRDPQPGAADRGATLLVVPDPERTVSRTHARIDVNHRGVTITDLDSSNGTTIELHGIRRDVTPGQPTPIPRDARLLVRDQVLVVLEALA
jgi:hypothetical protein